MSSSNDEKIRKLVQWDSTDAQAIADQLAERVRKAQTKGITVGVVTCLIAQHPDGRSYEVGISHLPVEISFWAAKEIAVHIEQLQFGESA